MKKKTKLTFQSSRILLDKGVVRRVYEFQVRFANNAQPIQHQIDAVRLFNHLQAVAAQIYITRESANVLRLRQPRYAKAILDNTVTLRKGRYLRRWSRRLRSLAFSREDACMVAYASFGLDAHSQIPNIEALVTNDFRLVNNFTAQRPKIKERFERMIVHLPDPYLKAKLPAVLTTLTALARI
jgi:hypothetical protein